MVMGKNYTHLSVFERERIVVLKGQGKSLREIAKVLEKGHSTISRELRRNRILKDEFDYVAYTADQKAKSRRRAGRSVKLKTEWIRAYVHKKLKKGWSPEQISGRIKKDTNGMQQISYEAIYQYIYTKAKDLIGFLPRRHKRRYPKNRVRKVKGSQIPNRIRIEERPLEANSRTQFGHWESDAIVSKASLAALNVLVERMSRYTKLSKLARNTARLTEQAIVRRLGLRHRRSWRTITYDNGSENTNHERINQELKIKSYFCNPYHSWEKGTIENTNGLIRRFIPKRTDIERISTTDIQKVENMLNNRPRKCLKYQTPKEVFNHLTGALQG